MKVCCSCRCALTQHQCTATLVKVLLLCKRCSKQALCCCNYIYEDFLFIRACSDPTPMLCSATQGKTDSPLFSAALQNRLTAGLSHCKYTYKGLFFIQVYSDPRLITAALVRAECIPHCSVLLCKTGSQQACVTAVKPVDICSSYRSAKLGSNCSAALNIGD